MNTVDSVEPEKPTFRSQALVKFAQMQKVDYEISNAWT